MLGGGYFFDRAVLGAGSVYAAQLAAVGLHPENPDAMLAALRSFLRAPQAFKNKDPHWPGTKDDLSWWEEPKGHAKLMWPFGGGSWLDAHPRNDAQVRAVFQIPAGTSTAAGLSKAYGRPGKPGFNVRMPYGFKADGWSGGGSNFLADAVHEVAKVYNAIPAPVRMVLAPATAITEFAYAHPESIPMFGKQAAQAKALFEGLQKGNVDPASAANIAAQALGPSVHLPPEVSSQVAALAHQAAAAEPLASQALQIAQASGAAATLAAVPHPSQLAAAPPPPARREIHLTLAEHAAAGAPPPPVTLPPNPAAPPAPARQGAGTASWEVHRMAV